MLNWFKSKENFPKIGFTSDCHCHLLAGVDDGVKTAEDAEIVFNDMLRNGITSVTLTPHINPDIFQLNTEDYLERRYDDFMKNLSPDIRSSIDISLGAEYMVVNEFEHRDMTGLLQFRPGKILIEMSYLYVSSNIEETIFSINMAGLKPVIAHPERYLYLAGSMDTFERYHDMGAEFQMNLMSLGGAYGPGSMRILKYILENGWYSYCGTDTHSPEMFRTISEIKFDGKLLRPVQEIVKSNQ